MPTSRTSSWLWPEGKSGLLSILIFPLALRNREICSRIANTSVNILRTLLCARHHVLAPWTLPVILCSKNSYYCFFSETLSDFSEATCLWNGGTSICTLALWLQSEFLKKIWWPPPWATILERTDSQKQQKGVQDSWHRPPEILILESLNNEFIFS